MTNKTELHSLASDFSRDMFGTLQFPEFPAAAQLINRSLLTAQRQNGVWRAVV